MVVAVHGHLQERLGLMSQKDTVRATLDTLGAKQAPSRSDQPDSDGSSDWMSDVDKIVQELRVKLAEAAENAEDLAIAHPFATLTAALLLGIVIGRTMGRTK
jgi:hypothetical protein